MSGPHIEIWERCGKHNVSRLAGVECYQCATERATTDRLQAIVETLHIHSQRMDRNFDSLMVLEARISDQDAEIAALWSVIRSMRARIRELELSAV